MITQEDIDAMEDGMGLVERLRGLQVSYQYAGEAADRIEQLERELTEANRDHDIAMRHNNLAAEAIAMLGAELAAEETLSDRLAANYAMSLNDKQKVRSCPALSAYRKARGL